MSCGVHLLEFHLFMHTGVEIDDEEAEKIFTANDAVALLKVKLDAL